ncbi:hypothetical protein POSPLADRAFT_1058601 [Postia placenta MAD-698-R-SB12]|uniref:Uncharacterized protein n=1 Tax=Postia placenta MAD-698-R-SB12 TaxID=670580 RepID=A0A1X6MVP8_9APHY|nr:hypothetical protein POSPLADRAFT_1058601 [Postia placenta MAD-698-R-SB12]OSX60438.1 hypothetical protein POSPLADRAFT_1058601 [Postia placenta MAD-698-R-SB12]
MSSAHAPAPAPARGTLTSRPYDLRDCSALVHMWMKPPVRAKSTELVELPGNWCIPPSCAGPRLARGQGRSRADAARGCSGQVHQVGPEIARLGERTLCLPARAKGGGAAVRRSPYALPPLPPLAVALSPRCAAEPADPLACAAQARLIDALVSVLREGRQPYPLWSSMDPASRSVFLRRARLRARPVARCGRARVPSLSAHLVKTVCKQLVYNASRSRAIDTIILPWTLRLTTAPRTSLNARASATRLHTSAHISDSQRPPYSNLMPSRARPPAAFSNQTRVDANKLPTGARRPPLPSATVFISSPQPPSHAIIPVAHPRTDAHLPASRRPADDATQPVA